MPNNDTVAIQVRVSGPLRKKVEDWRKAQDRVPPLSQTLRLLLEKALGVKHEPSAMDKAA